MEKYIQQLSADSESSLQYIIGKKVQSVMSGNFEIYYDMRSIIATTISIFLSEHRYLVVYNDWSDTEKEAIDYYFLETKVQSIPEDIKITDDPNKTYTLHHPNHSTLSLGESSKVVSVSIYEYIEIGDIESVQYDSVLLFKRQNGRDFLIKNENSIRGFLEIIVNKEQIKDCISSLNCRKIIQ